MRRLRFELDERDLVFGSFKQLRHAGSINEPDGVGQGVGWCGWASECCVDCLTADIRAGRAEITNPEDMAALVARLDVEDPFRGRGPAVRSLLRRLIAANAARGVEHVDHVAAALEAAARIGGVHASRLASAILAVLERADADSHADERVA